MFSRTWIFLLASTWSFAAFAAEPSMRLTIPRAAHAPTLDGKLAAGEWDDAAAVTGLINQFDGLAHPRQATFWIAFDDANVYVAQRSTLLIGERKTPPTMPPLYFKDNQNTVVIAIAPNRVNSGDTPSNYRFMANLNSSTLNRREQFSQIKGVKFNAMSSPVDSLEALKAPNTSKAFNTFSADDTIWESEYAIPLSEMKVEKAPDGEEWGILLARDYPQLDQNAIVATTSYRFDWMARDWRNLALAAAYHIDGDYARAKLASASPVVQVLELGDPLSGRIKPVLSIRNPGSAETSVKVSVKLGDATPPQELTLTLAAGERQQFVANEVQAAPDVVSALSLSVYDASGSPLFQQQIPIRPGYGGERVTLVPDMWFGGQPKLCASQVVPLSVYNPIRNTLWVKIGAGTMGRPELKCEQPRVEVSIRRPRETKPFAVYPMSPGTKDWGDFELKTQLPDLSPGLYEVTASLLDKDNKLVARSRDLFVRYDHAKDLPWINNKIGVTDTVLAPWTPIDTKHAAGGLELSCWGRTYVTDGGGLPTHVRSLDEDILSSPVRIEITRDGKQVPLTAAPEVQNVTAAEHETNFQGSLKGDGWNIATTGHLEYDGYLRYRIRLEPQGQQRVDRIRFIVPLTPQQTRNLHAATGGLMRAMVSTIALKPEKGPLWDSSQQIGGPTANGLGLIVGNFKSYVWVGGIKRGIAFMADCDQGWVPDDTKQVSAIELVRTDAGAELILNLVARPFTFDHAREITFSLQATPIRPLPDDFRFRRMQLHIGSAFNGGDPDGWSWDGCQVWLNGELYLGGQGSAPFPLNWTKNIAWTKSEGRPEWNLAGTPGAVVTKYQAMNAFFHHPEIDDPRAPGLQGANWYGYLNPEITCLRDIYDASISQTELEYRIWRYERWIKETNLHGFYFDNAYTCENANPDAGLGYVIDLPDRPALHGKVQTGFAWTGIRELLKRLRTVIMAEGRSPVLWLHATDTYVISAYSFADVLLDGENLPMITPENPWFSEKWSPQYMQTLSDSAKWGLSTTMLDMRDVFPPHHLSAVARASFRDYSGYLMLHDVEGATWRYIDWSSLDTKRKADFFPYWDPAVASALQTGNEKVFASAFRQDNKLTVIVFNRQAETQKNLKLIIDPTALGIPATSGRAFMVKNLQSVEPRDPVSLFQPVEAGMSSQPDGQRINVLLDLAPHDYRLLRVE